jgi:23S rRNA (adenine2503-C2)-methyltransferase
MILIDGRKMLHLSTMKKNDLMGLDRSELEEMAKDMGLDAFRGQQIFRWLYQEGATSFDQMTDISKPIRARLTERTQIGELACEQILTSVDGSKKFLFKLSDGPFIESVLIPEKERVTLCVSSQA